MGISSIPFRHSPFLCSNSRTQFLNIRLGNFFVYFFLSSRLFHVFADCFLIKCLWDHRDFIVLKNCSFSRFLSYKGRMGKCWQEIVWRRKERSWPFCLSFAEGLSVYEPMSRCPATGWYHWPPPWVLQQIATAHYRHQHSVAQLTECLMIRKEGRAGSIHQRNRE